MQIKKIRGSVLAVTVIILGIVLVTALSISLVSLRERKASMSGSKSNIAFQAADSGIETVLNIIYNSKIEEFRDRCRGKNLNVFKSNVELYTDKDNDGTLELANCSEYHNDQQIKEFLPEIKNIKAVGGVTGGANEGSVQRAIEAAVAHGACAHYSSDDVSSCSGTDACKETNGGEMNLFCPKGKYAISGGYEADTLTVKNFGFVSESGCESAPSDSCRQGWSTTTTTTPVTKMNVVCCAF